jgi:hypothetical protein
VVDIAEKEGHVAIGNAIVRVDIDLKNGVYDVSDAKTGVVAIAKAHAEVDGLGVINSKQSNRLFDTGCKLSWKESDVADALGTGKTLTLHNVQSSGLELLTTFTLYDGKSFVVLGGGIVNHLSYAIRIKSLQPLAGGAAFPALEMMNPKNLNGGAGSTVNAVRDGTSLACENSLLLTFTDKDGARHSLVAGGLTYHDFAKYAALGKFESWDGYPGYWHNPELGETWRTIWNPIAQVHLPDDFPAVNVQVSAVDPSGRLVDAGTTYQPDDLFYVDVATADPFVALEQYGLAFRAATKAHPNIYNNLTLCGWFSGRNNAQALVDEMDTANKLGMMKTIPVTVRLEPDTYCWVNNGNTEQGWWDDAHWLKYGHLVAPYDTFRKWIAAVKSRGGNAETYFQCGAPSEDYAEAHPTQMLGGDISNLHRRHTHIDPAVVYDTTDKDFQVHMHEVWARLKEDGLAGVKFDYPDMTWRPEGGFDDKHATTASAYRAWFQMCRDGLGPDALIHERALGSNCLDVTAGIVDLQRVCGDSDKWLPGMSALGGLRWYKNRVVMSYYPDSKAFVKFDEKGQRIDHSVMDPIPRRSLITMLFTTAGRIELATSFTKLTPDVVHDLGRAFPMLSERSARPVDAFTGAKTPHVYVYRIDDQWSQVTLCNDDPAPATISAPLSGDQASTGSLGLDPAKIYYVYEFWNDKLVGKIAGSAKLEQPLAGEEARMYSVHEVLDHPQVISTNRHLMQGYLDLANVKWDAATKQLSGTAKVVGDEPFRITIADNGSAAAKCAAEHAEASLEPHADTGLTTLILQRADNGDVAWHVDY